MFLIREVKLLKLYPKHKFDLGTARFLDIEDNCTPAGITSRFHNFHSATLQPHSIS